MNQKDIPKSVEQYRERFKRAPLGQWSSVSDFGPFPTDTWEFYANGSGKMYQHSGSGDSLALFEWREVSERTIKFRVTGWVESDDDGEEPVESEATEADWCTLTYDFKLIERYTPIVVMFQVPEKENFKFWMTLEYLQFIRAV